MESTEIRIPATGVRSLCWHCDTLVDWVTGVTCYELDGTSQRLRGSHAYPFDAAVALPDCEFAVVYTRRATKGLVLKRGEFVREINRSFYRADAYEYPIALFRLPNGRVVLAHCPDNYNRLELEDVVTGERLTDAKSRKPLDYFVSRLAADDNAEYLLSAGWVWSPEDHVKVFNLKEALKDATHLDGWGMDLKLWGHESSACFGPDHRLTAWLWQDFYVDPDDSEEEQEKYKAEYRPFGMLKTVDLCTGRTLVESYPPAKVGTMGPLGKNHVIGFYEHPKVFDLRTGAVVHEWPHIHSGKQLSSIIWHLEAIPVMAFDARNARFAVADESGITVVQCKLP